MFTNTSSRQLVQSSWAIAALIFLSVTAFGITVWILNDISHEQQVVKKLTKHLPQSDLPDANALAGELKLQFRLSVLLCVNIFAFALAMGLLIQAYTYSERSLQTVRILANDVLASLDQGVITTDENGVVRSVNPHGQALIAMKVDSAHSGEELLPKLHRPLAQLCRSVLEARATMPDIDYTITEGEYSRVLRAGCSILRDKSRHCLGTVIHIRDVTEKVLTEKQLRRMERFTGLGSLATGLQHEIKNPLSALSLHIQLLDEALRSQECDDSAVYESLEILQVEIKRINQVLEDFRNYASFDALHVATVDIRRLIERVIELVKPQANEKGIGLRCNLPVEPVYTTIDSVRLEQVILNLLVNAFTASSKDDNVVVQLKTSEKTAHIEVIDVGCGVPESLHEKIFEPYFTTRNCGTGMGLALCEKIVQQHGGTIGVQSRKGESIFNVSLPLTTEVQDLTHNEEGLGDF